ncbi:MAG: hypothetical protein ACREJO_16615 [Phycisphaerales bacterium]
MGELERRTFLGAAGLGAVAAMAKAGGPGPLNPPVGAVAPSGPTLDDIYNALPPAPIGAFDGCTSIAGNSSNQVINTPGSYVLIGNLPVSFIPAPPSFTGITIACDNVTLDLNGFAITGQSAAGGTGVRVNNNAKNVVIRNGHFSGLTRAIYVEAGCSDILLEDLVTQYGFINSLYCVGNGVIVRRCACLQVRSPPAPGMPLYLQGNGCTIEECLVSGFDPSPNAYIGIFLSGNGGIVRRCTVTNSASVSGVGIAMSGQIAYRENTVINFTNKYSTTNGAGSGGGNV